MTRTFVRDVGRYAAPTILVYGLMLITGRMVLVPIVFVGLAATFRALFRSGHRLGPFAITLVLLAVQNLAAGILGGDGAADSLHAAIALSAIVPVAILFAGWWADPAASYAWVRNEMRGVELWIVALALGYAGFVALRWLTSPVSLGLGIPSLRNALTPAYALLVVLLLPPVLRPAVDHVSRWLIRWGVVVGAFGVFEFLVLRDRFWVNVANVDALIDVKRLSTARIHSFQVPADFYTHFGANYFRRLVSLYGDAITTSCYLALALLAVLVLWKRPRGTQIVALAVLAPAMMLGAVKGAFGVVAVGLLVATIVGSRFRFLLPSGAVVVLVACAASVLFGWGMQFVPWNSSAGLHVDGIGSAVRAVSSPLDGSFVLGDGVGSGGSGAVYANRVVDGHTPEARDVPGLDNGAGAILAQTGIVGLGLLLALFALVIDTTMRRAQDSRSVLLATAAVAALLCNFLMQEHALTLMTSLPFWMLGAVAVRASESYAAAPARFMPRMRRVRIDPVELDLANVVADAGVVASGVIETSVPPEPVAGDVGATDAPEPIVLSAASDLEPATGSTGASISLPDTPAPPPMISLADHRRGSQQAEDDPELLDLMLADLAGAPAAFQPARASAQHFQATISALREGLADFRRRTSLPRGGAGAVLIANVATLPAIEAALASCRADYTRMGDLESVDHLDVSRVGDPDGFEIDGRFLTSTAISAYRRYVFVNEFVDVNDMDLIVMLGPGSAEEAEVLKQLYPHLTIAILDEPAGLYTAERFLSAARPHDVVPYRATRGDGSPSLKRRKIHFLGHHRLGDLPRTKQQLVWVSGFFDELDARSARNYGDLLTSAGDYVYVSATAAGDLALHERTQEQTLSGYHLVERRTTPEGTEDTFWKRRRKL